MAEFHVVQWIDHEPAYNWWVQHELKKREKNASIRKQQTRYQKCHKFGIELTKTVEQALTLDAKNGTALWMDAISKELATVKLAFKILQDGKLAPIDHQFVHCQMVFDIKMEDFRCKARLVAGGHMTMAPATIMYTSVVSREIVRIALMIATLNHFEAKSSDILNAYVQAPATEKVWTTLGPEFGKDARKTVVTVRALYCHK